MNLKSELNFITIGNDFHLVNLFSGDYLGENNDFNKDVLKAFVALHDFTNLILVQALRQVYLGGLLICK